VTSVNGAAVTDAASAVPHPIKSVKKQRKKGTSPCSALIEQILGAVPWLFGIPEIMA
jgi:hypothetical protein